MLLKVVRSDNTHSIDCKIAETFDLVTSGIPKVGEVNHVLIMYSNSNAVVLNHFKLNLELQ